MRKYQSIVMLEILLSHETGNTTNRAQGLKKSSTIAETHIEEPNDQK